MKQATRLGRASIGAWLAMVVALGAYADPADPDNWNASNTYIVCKDTNPLLTALNATLTSGTFTQFALLSDAVNAAAAAAAAGTTIGYIVVVSDFTEDSPAVTEYSDNVIYPAIGAFTIVGYPAEHPESVVIKAADSDDPVLDLTKASSAVTVEGLTFSGGSVGIKVGNSGATIDRCYICDNVVSYNPGNHKIVDQTGAGILCWKGGAPTIQNCVINHNEGDGVRVVSGAPDIGFSTIVENGRNGVLTDNAGSATVHDSIIMRNAIGDTIQDSTATAFFYKFPLTAATAPTNWSWLSGSGWGYDALATTLQLSTPDAGNKDPMQSANHTYAFGTVINGNYTAPTPERIYNQMSNHVIAVGDDVLIGTVRVSVTLSSSSAGTLLLTPPNASSITLGTVDAGTNWSEIVFSDKATDSLPAAPVTGAAYLPASTGRLAALRGQAATGNWTFSLVDTSGVAVTAGVSLSATITIGELYWLQVVVDCSNYQAVSMQFDRWLNVDSTAYAGIEGRIEGSPVWNLIWEKNSTSDATLSSEPEDLWDEAATSIFDGDEETQQWVERSYDLKWAAGKKIYVRWTYRTNSSTACSGWNIDNIHFGGIPTASLYYGLNASKPLAIVSHSNDLFENAPALMTAAPSGTPCGGTYSYSNAHDYYNVATDPLICLDIHVDPKFNGAFAWIGRLLDRICVSECDTTYPDVKNHGGTAVCGTVPATTVPATDFKYTSRPDTVCGIADIGADEIGLESSTSSCDNLPYWYTCIVTDTKADEKQVVGLHTFTVDVWVQGGQPNAAYYKTADGTTVALTYLSSSGLQYSYQGAVPATAKTDGWANIFLDYNCSGLKIVLGDSSTLSSLVSSQARTGRKFLIDTIPPVRVGSGYAIPTTTTVFTADDIVYLANPAPYAARGVGFGWGSAHPYPALTSIWPQMEDTLTSRASHATYAPYPATVVEAPQVFFNVGSIANDYVAAHADTSGNVYLNVGLVGYFLDMNAVAYGTAFTSATKGTSTTSSGFNTTIGTTSGAVASILANTALPAYWDSSSGFGDLQATGGAKFTPTVTNSGTCLKATWEFLPSGLPIPSSGSLYVDVNMIGRDRAGNLSTDSLFKPPALLVHWLRGLPTELKIPITLRSDPGSLPSLDWALSRNVSISFKAGPKPIYTHRLWVCGDTGTDKNPESFYIPINGWQTWGDTPGNLSITPTQLEAVDTEAKSTSGLESGIYGRYVLLVVAACDEAGNVSTWPAWPDEELQQQTTGEYVCVRTDADSGRNWRRFYIPEATEQVDTQLSVDIIRDGESLGAQTLVSGTDFNDAAGLQAEFTVNLVIPRTASLLKARVEGELFEDGTSVYKGLLGRQDAGGDILPDATRVIRIPGDTVNGLTNGRLGHPATPGVSPSDARTVTYMFRATTVYYNGANDIADASPATFTFKVVPRTVEDYLQSPAGQQPVKTFERE